MIRRRFLWLGLLAWFILVGCNDQPDRPLPTETAVIGTAEPTLFDTSPSSATPTSTPAYSAADLQATVLARPAGPYTAFLIDEQRAFLGYDENLLILDISDPAQPMLLGELALAHMVKRIQVVDQTVFMVLKILLPEPTEISVQTADITNPASPEVLYTYQPGGGAEDAIVVDGLLHVFGRETKWLVVDVSNPAIFIERQLVGESVRLGCFHDGSNISEVQQGQAYLNIYAIECRASNRVILVFDISDPFDPVFLNSVAVTDGFAYRDENVVFVLSRSYLRAVDISERNRPMHLGRYYLGETGRSITNGKIALVEEYVYLGSSDGLLSFEAEDPATITLVNSFYPGVYFSQIEAANGYIYLLDWEDGLLILDPSDPENPVEVGRWQP